MYEVDLDKFWADDEIAHRDNCFCKDSPQVALGIRAYCDVRDSELWVVLLEKVQ